MLQKFMKSIFVIHLHFEHWKLQLFYEFKDCLPHLLISA